MASVKELEKLPWRRRIALVALLNVSVWEVGTKLGQWPPSLAVKIVKTLERAGLGRFIFISWWRGR